MIVSFQFENIYSPFHLYKDKSKKRLGAQNAFKFIDFENLSLKNCFYTFHSNLYDIYSPHHLYKDKME